MRPSNQDINKDVSNCDGTEYINFFIADLTRHLIWISVFPVCNPEITDASSEQDRGVGARAS